MNTNELFSQNTDDIHNKNLKHIMVYNKLHELIITEVFPIGYQLPTEPDLAIKMNVSRVTLRKALSILRDEGLIINMRGKGNFVTAPNNTQTIEYTKKIRHPIYHCVNEDINNIDFKFKIEPPNDEIIIKLNQETSVMIVCERQFKHNSSIIGVAISYLPIESITEFKINLNTPKELEDFIEKHIYSQTIKSKALIKYSSNNLFPQNFSIILEEKLLSRTNSIMMYTEYFIPTDNFELKINLTDKFEF